MISNQLEASVKEQFGMGLHAFVKKIVEEESLYDYEIASLLNIKPSFFVRLRSSIGINRSKGFSRRFENTYGRGAVEKFKRLIEDPGNSLADVGNCFGFSRQNAWLVFKKIYGCPYTETYKRKAAIIKQKNHAPQRKSKSLDRTVKVKEKMESIGLSSHITKKKYGYMILTNGYKLALRSTSKPRKKGRKQYFHISTKSSTIFDCDFFICLCQLPEKTTYYVIPSDAMPASGVSLIPQAGSLESKYTQFREAWHLLKHENAEGGVHETNETGANR